MDAGALAEPLPVCTTLLDLLEVFIADIFIDYVPLAVGRSMCKAVVRTHKHSVDDYLPTSNPCSITRALSITLVCQFCL